MNALTVGPRHQGEQWPPRVPDERHPAVAKSPHGLDRVVEPFPSPFDRADGRGLRNKDRRVIPFPIHGAKFLDDLTAGVRHLPPQAASSATSGFESEHRIEV